MAYLSTEKLIEIRNSVDIIDVISSYIPLVQKGKNYFGVCPFHDDHSPSMSVSKEKQIYTCFSCGATGNVYKFIMDYEHITFMETVKKVSEMVGINLDININSKQNKSKNNSLYEMYDISLKFYQNNLNTQNGIKAKEYLKERNIDDDIIKEFQIGLALKNHDLLTKLLIKKNFKEEDIKKSGLVTSSDYGLGDIYYNRIMFPLHDLAGRPVGFSGRIFDSKDTSKYVNTRETEIFKKGEILYNYYRAKEECRKLDTVIVMEGFMDVIRAYTVGIKNVIATMGTAVTKNQADLIKHMAKNVILCFDGDKAGAKATYACSNELLKINVTPKIVRLENNLDPDDYIKKYGLEKFKEKLENPMNIMDFKLSYLKDGKNLDATNDIASYVNDMIKELSQIDDEILREITLNKISKESNLDIEFLRSKIDNTKKSIPKKEIIKSKKTYTKYQKAEIYLIYYMLKSTDVIKIYNKKITYMPTEKYRFLAREISNYYKDYQDINIADLMIYLENEELLNTLNEIINLNLKEEYTLEEIEDYINVIREYNVNNEYERLTKLLKQETDPNKKVLLGEQILNLKKVRGNEYV